MGPRWREPLTRFFEALVEAGEDREFHPHPLTPEGARERAEYAGRDLYVVASADGEHVLGYGMLRGWDEGFEVPSLGIAVHPLAQKQGIGTRLMEYLHQAARERGARRIRLKVHPGNVRARRLYERFGYRFSDEREDDQFVGYLAL